MGQTVSGRSKRESKLNTGLLVPLAVLWLTGVMLRLTILALPPVIGSVAAEFQLNGSDIGVLTAIPVFFFSLAAIPGSLLIRRLGAASSLLVGLFINGLGTMARGFAGDAIALELATSCMCLGVAIMQPAMPTLVREWTPTRIGLATATYTCGLLCGEVLPAAWPFAIALPLVQAGWRASLSQWGVPVLVTALLVQILRAGKGAGLRKSVSGWWPDWRNGTVWRVGLLLGAVNAAYFGLNGFVPGWLTKAGSPNTVRPALLALNAAQIPASLLLLILLERVVFRRWGYIMAGLAMLTGSVGLAIGPASLAIAFAALAGFAMAWLLTLALALPPLLVDERQVPSISAGVFTVSYAIAVLTALLTGVLVSSGQGGGAGIIPIAAAALAVIAVGTQMRPPVAPHAGR